MTLLGAVSADAGRELGTAGLLDAAEVRAALADLRDGTVEDLVHEELHVGATLGDAVRDARDAEGRWLHLQIDASEGALNDRETIFWHALTAICRADRAGLKALADTVRAHRADTAVVLARRARLGRLAEPVATSGAFSAIGRAGEAILGRRVADAVAARLARTAVGGAVQTVFAGFAEAVAAGLADAAIARAARASLVRVTAVVTARSAEAAVFRAARTRLGGIADHVAAARAGAAIARTARAGLALVALVVAAALTDATVGRAVGARLAVFAGAITAASAEPAVAGARVATLAQALLANLVAARVARAATGPISADNERSSAAAAENRAEGTSGEKGCEAVYERETQGRRASDHEDLWRSGRLPQALAPYHAGFGAATQRRSTQPPADSLQSLSRRPRSGWLYSHRPELHRGGAGGAQGGETRVQWSSPKGLHSLASAKVLARSTAPFPTTLTFREQASKQVAITLTVTQSASLAQVRLAFTTDITRSRAAAADEAQTSSPLLGGLLAGVPHATKQRQPREKIWDRMVTLDGGFRRKCARPRATAHRIRVTFGSRAG